MPIHSTAIVDRTAEIDPTAQIGPYVIIDGPVRVGPEVRVDATAQLTGWTTIERGCRIHHGAVIGDPPQDHKYAGARSYCHIGPDTTIREFATVHRGTSEESATVIGSNGYIMAYAHVGHNCTLGDNVTLTNSCLVGGHVQMGDRAIVGGQVGVHQFVRIGCHAMVGGLSRLVQDLPPFMMAVGNSTCVGPNLVGMRRAGLGHVDLRDVKECYRLLNCQGLAFPTALARIEEAVTSPSGRKIVEFLRAPTKRGICTNSSRRRIARPTGDAVSGPRTTR